MLPFDFTGIIAVLGAGGTIALGLLVWLVSVVLRALFGGRRRASPIAAGCGCLLGMVAFVLAAAVPLAFFAMAFASA